MAQPKEFGEILKDCEELDNAYDKQVSQRAEFDKVHDAAQRKAIKQSGTGIDESARGLVRKQGAKFDDRKVKR